MDRGVTGSGCRVRSTPAKILPVSVSRQPLVQHLGIDMIEVQVDMVLLADAALADFGAIERATTCGWQSWRGSIALHEARFGIVSTTHAPSVSARPHIECGRVGN